MPTHPINTSPSFSDIEFAVRKIAVDIKRSNFSPTLVVALARGGAVPGVMLSHQLRLPLLVIHYSSKNGRGDNKNHTNQLPPIDASKRVIFADDLVDSGRSLDEVVEWYTKESGQLATCQVRTATLYAKDGSVHWPNFYWQYLPPDAPFIHFPWELSHEGD